MSRVVVDSSVWIEYLNNRMDFEEVLKLDHMLENEEEILLCPVVYQEILQGVRDEKLFLKVKSLLGTFQMLLPNFPVIEDKAIQLYRSLRKQGITIRKSNDCLIAAYSLVYDAPVLFKDRDFEAICEHSDVRRF